MSPDRAKSDDDDLRREAIRLARRYIDEVVLELGLCPWAEPALERGSVRIEPNLAPISTVDQAAEAARSTADLLRTVLRDEALELVLVPFPRMTLSRVELDQVVRHLRTEPAGDRIALAAFHPEPAPPCTTPDQALSWLRRSPDPMIQVVRSSVLDRIDAGRGGGTRFADPGGLLSALSEPRASSPRDRVSKQNWASLSAFGLSAFSAKIDEIQKDRERSYAALQRDQEPQ